MRKGHMIGQNGFYKRGLQARRRSAKMSGKTKIFQTQRRIRRNPEEDPEEDLREDELEENDDNPQPAAGVKGFEIQAVAAFPLWDTQGEAHSRQLPALISSARHSSRAKNRPTCPRRHSISWPLPPTATTWSRPAAEHC